MADYLFLPSALPVAGFAILLALAALGVKKVQGGVAVTAAGLSLLASLAILTVQTPREQTILVWSSLADGSLALAISFRVDNLSRFSQILPPLLAFSAILFTFGEQRFAGAQEDPAKELAAESTGLSPYPTGGKAGMTQELKAQAKLSSLFPPSPVILRGRLTLAIQWLRTPVAKEDPGRQRSYILLFGLLAAAQTSILAGNLLLIYAGWEVFLLLGTFLLLDRAGREMGTDETVGALALPHAVGFLLLAAFVRVGYANRSFDLARIDGATLSATSFYLVSLVVVARASFFSLRVWPGMLRLPSPMVSLLSGGLAGWLSFYVLARWLNLSGQNVEVRWQVLIAAVTVTIAVASVLHGLRQTNLSAALGSVAVSQGALALLYISVGGPSVVSGALLQLLGGNLLLVAMLLCAQRVETVVGTQDMSRLRGLAALLPTTAATFISSAVLLAGVPSVSINFLAQWLIYGGMMHGWLAILMVISLAVNAFAFAALIRAGFSTFFGRPLIIAGEERTDDIPSHTAESLWTSTNAATVVGIGSSFLVVCLAGLLPWLTFSRLIQPAAALLSEKNPPSASLLTVLGTTSGGWAVYVPPLLIFLSLLGGFFVYYQATVKPGRALTLSPQEGESKPDLDQALTAWDYSPFGRQRGAGSLSSLAYLLFRATLGVARWGERLAGAVENRYYVVAVLLGGLVVLFIILE